MWIERNGPTWRIRDLVAGQKTTVASGFATKTAAKAAKVQLEADALRGQSLVPRGGDMTLDDWIDMWWPSYSTGLKPSARVSAEGIIRRHIRPMLGGQRLGRLDSLTVQRFVADLLAGRTHVRKPKPLAAKTVLNIHGQLYVVLRDAVAQRLIASNPCEHTTLPAGARHEMKFLSEPEADRLIAAVPPHWRPLVLVLLATGMRWGEAIGLRVRHVDVLAGTIRVLRQTQELADTAELVDEEPKTLASRRTVSIPPAVCQLLVPHVAGKGPDDRVFLAPRGGPVRTRRFYVVWQKARVAAGLEGLRVHDLRHTHAAWLIADGVPLTAVQRRLGHTSIKVTSDLYGHILPEVDDRVVLAVAGRLSKIDFRGEVGETATDHRVPVSP